MPDDQAPPRGEEPGRSDSVYSRRSLREVALLFLRLGATAFGGPAAHIGMMHDEVLSRRRWLTDQQFLDLVGATNLIPGPNSTEMAIHIGYMRAGWRGLLLGGLCFMIPAAVAVLVLSWAYVRFGSTPQAEWLLYGVKPVVIAVIVQALWSLGRKVINGILPTAIVVGVVTLYFFRVNEIALLFVGGLVMMVGRNVRSVQGSMKTLLLVPLSTAVTVAGTAAPFSFVGLFLNLLKIGAVWYGSGYVLLAFLRADFVDRLGWLTDQQLIDAIAISQITPGPLFTAATFIGYLLGGVFGAVGATVAICLPSFVFVALSNPLIPRIRKSRLAGSLLDGVNVAALGLMGAVTWQLGRASIVDPVSALLAIAAVVLLFRYRINSVWLIAGGALVGLVTALF
ncbi:MAG: chromate efflux transporter [candidate division Zixibacteria bacterium]|nr:chromate efflux transporter [candidate division Zixibacteria bacterium]